VQGHGLGRSGMTLGSPARPGPQLRRFRRR
jgi:hypothetical protein